jgi:hypothetical protein
VSPTFVVDGDDDFELAFDPPVYAVGLRLLTNFAADEVVTLTLEDGTTKTFEEDELGTDPNDFEFVGFKSLHGIVAVSVDTDGGDVQNEGIDGVESADFFQVRIDVRPDNSQNPVNCKSRGKVKVAILSEPGFSAPRRVDQSTLRFGATGTEPSLAFCKGKKDENHDGLKDLTCHFYTEIADFCSASPPGEAILTGFTHGGTPIAGSDSVWIVPGSDQPDDHGPKDKKKKKKKDKDRDDDDRDDDDEEDDDDGPGRGNGNGRGSDDD